MPPVREHDELMVGHTGLRHSHNHQFGQELPIHQHGYNNPLPCKSYRIYHRIARSYMGSVHRNRFLRNTLSTMSIDSPPQFLVCGCDTFWIKRCHQYSAGYGVIQWPMDICLIASSMTSLMVLRELCTFEASASVSTKSSIISHDYRSFRNESDTYCLSIITGTNI